MLDNKIVNRVIEHFYNLPINEFVIKKFAQTLYDKFDLAFHFDDQFDSYVDEESREPLFNKPQANALDHILDNMWKWCDKNHIDIHELAGDVQQKEFKKRGILPQGDDELEESVDGPAVHNNIDLLNLTGKDLINHIKSMGRENIISWLQSNDPNGMYSDEEMMDDDEKPLTWEEAAKMMYDQISRSNGSDELEESIASETHIATGYEGLEEAPMQVSNQYDRIREKIKVGATYYDQYTMRIFTVDKIEGEFVCCTNVNDETDKWNEDIISFNRAVTMGAFDLMPPNMVKKKEPVLQEDESNDDARLTRIRQVIDGMNYDVTPEDVMLQSIFTPGGTLGKEDLPLIEKVISEMDNKEPVYQDMKGERSDYQHPMVKELEERASVEEIDGDKPAIVGIEPNTIYTIEDKGTIKIVDINKNADMATYWTKGLNAQRPKTTKLSNLEHLLKIGKMKVENGEV